MQMSTSPEQRRRRDEQMRARKDYTKELAEISYVDRATERVRIHGAMAVNSEPCDVENVGESAVV